MEATTTEKRKALRKMMQGPGCHIAPSCNDGIQARLVEWLGLPPGVVSGSGHEWLRGVRAIHSEAQMTPKRAGHEGFDVGVVSKEEMVAKIKAAVDTRRDENMVIIARSEVKYA